MPGFRYVLQDKEGRLVRGISTERKEVPAPVQKMKDLKRQFGIKFKRSLRRRRGILEFLFPGRVPLKDLVVFSRQFATLFASGTSLPRAFDALSDQTENKALRQAIREVGRSVREGITLADSMARFPKIFPWTYITMIRAGEKAGILDKVLDRLASQYDKEQDLKEKIITAFAYPSVVVFVSTGVVIFLVVFVIPMFEKLYSGGGVQLPLPTRIVLGISYFLRGYWYIPPILIISLIYAIKVFRKTDIGKEIIDYIKLKFPLFGNINHKAALVRFSRTLSAAIGSGLSLVSSLELVADVAGNVIVNKSTKVIVERILEGDSMATIMRKDALFPPILVRMIGTGEETGAVDEMLSRAADFYEREIDHAIKRLTTMLEPILIVTIGGIVFVIALAMYLPIFNLGEVIK